MVIDSLSPPKGITQEILFTLTCPYGRAIPILTRPCEYQLAKLRFATFKQNFEIDDSC